MKRSDGFGRMLVVICVEEDFDNFLHKGGPCHLINLPKGVEHTAPNQNVLEFTDEYGYAKSEVYLHYVRTTAATDLKRRVSDG